MVIFLIIFGSILVLGGFSFVFFFLKKNKKSKNEVIYPTLEEKPKELDEVLHYRGDRGKNKGKVSEFFARRTKNKKRQESLIAPRIPQMQEKKEAPAYSKGKLLFAIPHRMNLQEEHLCTVRLGYSFKSVLEDLKTESKPKISEVPISETMKVELVDCTQNEEGQGLYFKIKALNSPVQFIDMDISTEWRFWVTPLRVGKLPLLLRISIVKMVNGVERYRETVKEIITEVSTLGGEAGIETTIDVPLEETSDNYQKVREEAINKSLQQLYHLLSEYETKTDLEDDPKAKMRYAQEMEDIRKRIAYYEKQKKAFT